MTTPPGRPDRSSSFDELDASMRDRWMRFGLDGDTTFPVLLGLVVEDVRTDWCRMRLPFADHLLQAQGVMHGGALASLLDHVVVPAVGSQLEAGQLFSTVDMHVQFMRPILGGDDAQDVLGEGWVTRRGRRTVFCEAEAYGADSGELVAKSVLTYSVSPPR